MAFYYHFQDIYDLVEWACQEDARRILDGKRTYTTWQEGFRRILDGLIDNRPFILNVYRSVRREQVETFLFQVTHGLLMGVVEELDPRGEVREEDKAFLADFYKYAFVGLVLDWIRTGMKGEPAELARRVELVVSGSFAQALERLLAAILKPKAMKEYGAVQEDIPEFAASHSCQPAAAFKKQLWWN